MDEYIEQLQSSIGPQSSCVDKRYSKYREVFGIVATSKPDLKIIECDEDGRIRFEVTTKSLGISYETIMKYRNELSSDYMANVLGELVIREHLNKFVKLLTNMKEQYLTAVNKYEHKKFGLRAFSGKFIFTFHASLLQRILTEDFKKQV